MSIDDTAFGDTAFGDTAFELAPTGLAVVDTDERLIRVNRRFARMVRRSAEELEGRSFVDLVHPDDRERADLRLSDLPAHTMHDRGRVRFVRPDDSVVWGASASPGHRVARPSRR